MVVVVVVVVVVGVEDDDDDELLELDDDDELLDVQCWASWATVAAPWLRFDDRVVLTVEGRLVTALVRAAAALAASLQ